MSSAPASLRVIVLCALLLSGCLVPTASQPQPAAMPVAPTPPVAPPVATDVVVLPAPTVAGGAWAPPPRTKTAGCSGASGLPDPACTPGAVDPRVNQADLSTTACSRGYTATVRPPVSVTEKIKHDQMTAYGLQGQRLADYELDHLISLELGGAPQDIANLWPEPWTGDPNAHMKDAVETELNRQVCRGTMQLADAQQMIATDWVSVYNNRGLIPAQ